MLRSLLGSEMCIRDRVFGAYLKSFFSPKALKGRSIGAASVRAGNVIGGGDWGKDRLVPDCIRALSEGRAIEIRNPRAVRPWQHVLEPLAGYLMLAESLCKAPKEYSEGWNFGPKEKDAKSVIKIINAFCRFWGNDARHENKRNPEAQHEAGYLKLDSSKAQKKRLWKPRWNSETAVRKTVEWYKAYLNKENLDIITAAQIKSYYG